MRGRRRPGRHRPGPLPIRHHGIDPLADVAPTTGDLQAVDAVGPEHPADEAEHEEALERGAQPRLCHDGPLPGVPPDRHHPAPSDPCEDGEEGHRIERQLEQVLAEQLRLHVTRSLRCAGQPVLDRRELVEHRGQGLVLGIAGVEVRGERVQPGDLGVADDDRGRGEVVGEGAFHLGSQELLAGLDVTGEERAAGGRPARWRCGPWRRTGACRGRPRDGPSGSRRSRRSPSRRGRSG